jgi:ergothioneine biosynthesis protein EgtB
MSALDASAVHTPRARHAGRDALSLGLIDARNRSLRWIGAFEAAPPVAAVADALSGIDPPVWTLGHAGWFQERWIARNVQRQRGPACDLQAARLPSVDPAADRLFDPEAAAPDTRWSLALPTVQAVKQVLAETIEITLDLLAGAAEDEAGLHFYRLALLHEDACAEALAVAAQTLGVPLPADATEAAGLVSPWRAVAPREPLLFPATRWTLGSPDLGFVFDHEREPHAVPVPEFEIDAQPVSWAQFGEFVEDGGYDEAGWWSADGWAWVQREGRRTPRHVEQMRQAVLQRRHGRSVRVPLAQPVAHVSAHEAEAWCRWAGRRLPSEVEWEAAAHQGASRGFRWGEVLEWTAGRLRPYPGYRPMAGHGSAAAFAGPHRALRGASVATPGRLRDPKLRRWARPEVDALFVGFRSCAV